MFATQCYQKLRIWKSSDTTFVEYERVQRESEENVM